MESGIEITLRETLINAVTQMESSRNPSTRRCIFQEYKEWLGKDIDDDVWLLPQEWNKQNTKEI